MAKFRKMVRDKWDEWVKTRPPIIQEMCRKFPPNTLFRLKPSKSRVFVYSYNENGTMTVIVSGQFNKLAFERRVFDVKPENLEECDLPGPYEEVGVSLTKKKDIEAFIDFIRPAMERRREAADAAGDEVARKDYGLSKEEFLEK